MADERDLLGIPAAVLLASRLKGGDVTEKDALSRLARSCQRMDHRGRGSLSDEDYYTVVKRLHAINIRREELESILKELPRDKAGLIKIEDFFTRDIHSQEAFKVFDRNRDGFISKGELKLAKQKVPMADITDCIKKLDMDGDGKLNRAEFSRKSHK